MPRRHSRTTIAGGGQHDQQPETRSPPSCRWPWRSAPARRSAGRPAATWPAAKRRWSPSMPGHAPTAASMKAAKGTGPAMATCVPRKASRPRMFGKRPFQLAFSRVCSKVANWCSAFQIRLGAISSIATASAAQVPGCLQRGASLRRDDGVDRIAERQVDHRVFGVEAEADRHAERNAGCQRRPLDMVDDRQQADRPEQQQRHVGRHQRRRNRRARHQRIDQRRPEGDAARMEFCRDRIDDQRCREMHQRRRQADAERRVAAQRGGRADDPGDQRRLGVVAERRLLAPRPILRLVEEQLGVGDGKRDDADSRDRDQQGDSRIAGPGSASSNDRPRRPSVVSPTICRLGAFTPPSYPIAAAMQTDRSQLVLPRTGCHVAASRPWTCRPGSVTNSGQNSRASPTGPRPCSACGPTRSCCLR